MKTRNIHDKRYLKSYTNPYVRRKRANTSPLPVVVLREAVVREKDPRRNERTNARAILTPAEQEKERANQHYQKRNGWVWKHLESDGDWLFKGVRWVWERSLKDKRKGGSTVGEHTRGRDRKGVEVERRRHGARREAEGRRRTDHKRHLRTDGSEQLISSSRFTVSLPRPTKWVTRGRVPSLTQPTVLLNICIKVQALPSRPPSIFPFCLAAFWLRCASKQDCWC